MLDLAKPHFPKYCEEDSEKAWMFIVSTLAENPQMHFKGGKFGQALAKANVSSTQVNTLLTTDLPNNLGYFRATLRQVMSKEGSTSFVRFNCVGGSCPPHS